MERRFSERLAQKQIVVRKEVALEFRQMYGQTPLLDEILESIQDDSFPDRKLTRTREKKWGQSA